MRRLYLDNAATSWPKPDAVYDAVDDWQRRVGASYARGASAAADETRAIVDRARRSVAQLLGESDPRRVVFTNSGTDSLNLALRGLLRAGDHVVSTVCEHNAVLRPLEFLCTEGVETTWVGCDSEGVVSVDEVAAALRPETKLIAIVHASNVTGAIQPVEEVASFAKSQGVRLLVDAAQTLGRLPLDVRSLGADLIAAPGHKGLYGPLGTGVLWLAPGIEEDLRPLRLGGAASGGDRLEMPETLPDKFEAGSLNAPGLAGLAAGVEHVLATGVEAIRQRMTDARGRLASGLAAMDGVRVYGPSEPLRQAGVVSFSTEGYDPHELAMLLASVGGIECRAGLHCAPRMHAALGTARQGGLVRFSPGPGTTDSEIDAAVTAVGRLIASPLT
ncbi:putative cysteine desulfurase [Botrimarina colliarenosi]|uniref:cysteine desulfurase n=1 Tax=Botrimarina colliarenosi TaxID=2528001 RepID=A0A5C6A750_9BACT|nr:aminotransferase class V-fold PLP-dependent enzyme [Botrimarina colliarenosi]TWT95822.1 putative cysteine desulfurase [Botrimarina colliarenosi]